jgi:SAM-dependent methyltransferase
MTTTTPLRSKWQEFYATRFSCEGYRTYVQWKYETYLGLVAAAIEPGDLVLEVGTGTGVITSILKERRPLAYYRAMDIDPGMVEEAKKLLPYPPSMVYRGDMRLPKCLWPAAQPNVIHGMGVLEHLSDQDIRRHIRAAQEVGAEVLIHYVPGELHLTPSFGDERLLDPLEWQRIAQPTEIVLFNGAADYVLIWRFER